MRRRRRFTAGMAALLIGLGALCPILCGAAGEQENAPAHEASHAFAAPKCHGAAPPPADEAPEPIRKDGDCLHCASPVLSSAADALPEPPPFAWVAIGPASAWRDLATGPIPSAQAHDPPTRNLLLITNVFLL